VRPGSRPRAECVSA